MPIAIPSELEQAKAAIAALLHWPENIGIEFRPLTLPTHPETELLAIFIIRTRR